MEQKYFVFYVFMVIFAFNKIIRMDVSIIIINYRTAGLIVNCINSIIKFTKDVSYEIIVVDNNSMDNCEKTLLSLFPRENIVFLGLNQNIGFGRANNKGFEIAKGRNVFCLNPDTLLLNNAVKELSDYLDGHEDVGVCGGNLYDEELRPMHSFVRYFPSLAWSLHMLTFRKTERLIYGKNSEFNHSGHTLTVAYVTGADLMIKKELLTRFGGYSPDFFMYYEETDLCYRIRSKGYKVVSVPTAKIQHLEGRSFDKEKNVVNDKRIRMMEESRSIYYKRNVGTVQTIISNNIYHAALLLNKFVFKMFKREIWKNYEYRLLYFKELNKRNKQTVNR